MNEGNYTFEIFLGKEDFKNKQLILGLSFLTPGKMDQVIPLSSSSKMEYFYFL
ncbi:hypothetical protein SAMN03080598_00193 [Algoriphagus boritolerans DSM 17298 = JCM 18970]|uniref:Uncharacterized protein n=1 Tax=Algoriphagus boritolerans DSM 17298 = JCM 18970 TaxID=1120964 RepID=A0A1H5RYT8_9BACT|nr:hypothetical protein SAMN03080598_00193 [Algoriphagus boritolerans DSM 17298 = JCM 18970]